MSYVEIGVDKEALAARKAELARQPIREPSAPSTSITSSPLPLLIGGVLVAAGVAYVAMRKT